MNWPKQGLPFIQWGRTPQQTASGGRRWWLTVPYPTTIFPWRVSRTEVPSTLVTGTMSVAGVVTLSVVLTPTQSATVTGSVLLDVNHIIGAIITGVARCTGQVQGAFVPSIAPSAVVIGEALAQFYTRVGQQVGCVTSPETPLTPGAGSIGPVNAVH